MLILGAEVLVKRFDLVRMNEYNFNKEQRGDGL